MKKAITLVEMLIATAILLAAIIPIWGLIGSSNQQVMKSYDEIKASQLTMEILEQIENYCSAESLSDEEDGKDYALESNGTIKISEDSPDVQIGTFDDYFEPKLNVRSVPITVKESLGEKLIGSLVSLTLSYNTKEGHNSKYYMRGFVSAK